MSDAKKASDFRLEPGTGWGRAYQVAGVLGALGVVLAAVGAFTDMHRFAFSYLFAFVAFLMIALGSIFFCLLQWITAAGWSVSVRRTAEFMLWPIWLFPILFLPIYANMDQLYSWTQLGHHEEGAESEHGEAAEGEEHEEHEGHEGHDHGGGHADHGGAHGSEHSGDGDAANVALGPYDPASHWASVNEHAVHHAHEATLAKKVPFLNKTFFTVRFVLYFAAWLLIGLSLFRFSTRQDEDGDPKWTLKLQRLAPVSLIVVTFTSSFAAFDWLMSLEPSWFSTIFGVNFFADCIVSMLATTTLLCLALHRAGHFGKAVSVEHFHDLGKLLFGFVVFWAYVNFSQYMLIWYASLPEEVTYYHHRWVGGWKSVSLAILFGHFVLPFLIMVSRNAKRGLGLLKVGASMVLFFHFVMVYWLVMPYQSPGEFNPHWMDLACLLAVGGTYFALVFYRMTQHPIVPVNDPRLSRAVNLVNA